MPPPPAAPRAAVYLFLDVDGVLNSMRSIVAFRDCREEHLDQVAIRLFDRLCLALSENGHTPRVVISSTWRMMRPRISWWNDFFASRGCAGVSVVGCTPVFQDNEPNRRGREVARWMKERAPGAFYVCLDDDSDFLPNQPLVLVDPDYGLRVCDIDAAYRALTGEPMPGVPRIITKEAA
jgi:hypothetical protein